VTKEKNLGDILPVVERHSKYYEEKLKDFVQEDELLWRDDENNANIVIRYGTMLRHGNVWIPWGRLEVSHASKDGSLDLIEYAKKVLVKLGLKRFYDEDAEGGGLCLARDEWRECAICYINPDFPEGYWENHTLCDKMRI